MVKKFIFKTKQDFIDTIIKEKKDVLNELRKFPKPSKKINEYFENIIEYEINKNKIKLTFSFPVYIKNIYKTEDIIFSIELEEMEIIFDKTEKNNIKTIIFGEEDSYFHYQLDFPKKNKQIVFNINKHNNIDNIEIQNIK